MKTAKSGRGILVSQENHPILKALEEGQTGKSMNKCWRRGVPIAISGEKYDKGGNNKSILKALSNFLFIFSIYSTILFY